MPCSYRPRLNRRTAVILNGEIYETHEGSRLQTLFQIRIFRFGFLQKRNIRIGVFPQGEALLIRDTGLGACVFRVGLAILSKTAVTSACISL
jgi:hypothetical protein